LALLLDMIYSGVKCEQMWWWLQNTIVPYMLLQRSQIGSYKIKISNMIFVVENQGFNKPVITVLGVLYWIELIKKIFNIIL